MPQVQQPCLFRCACSVFIADFNWSNVTRDDCVVLFFIVSKRYCKSLLSRSPVTKRASFSQFFLTAQCFRAMETKKIFVNFLMTLQLVLYFVLTSINFIDLSSNSFCLFFKFWIVFMMLRLCLCQAELLCLLQDDTTLSFFHKLWGWKQQVFDLDLA